MVTFCAAWDPRPLKTNWMLLMLPRPTTTPSHPYGPRLDGLSGLSDWRFRAGRFGRHAYLVGPSLAENLEVNR
jgi:hypothetical protein